jgi:Leucine-rich repeat (LRR) protein
MATIDPASEESINELKAIGFLIQPISRNTNFLSVTAVDSVTLDQLKQLKKVKSQVAWLNLHRCNLQDGWLEEFLQFPNLTKLNVSENPISTVEAIVENGRLEKLNFHSTMIGDPEVQLLIPLKNLRRLHVWNTAVTSQGLDSFQLKRGDVILE